MEKRTPVKAEPPLTDREWVRRFLGGDASAFDRIVERHQERVLGICRRFARGEEAWDLWQETWVRAHANLARWTEGGEIAPWLMRIAINVGRDHARKRRSWLRLFRPMTSSAAEPQAPPEEAGSPEPRRAGEVRRAMERLSDRQREVVSLRFWGRLEIPQIAQALECSESSVKTHLYRALEGMKGDLRWIQEEGT